ncbi:adenine deaminase C-terminal domain-containing protein [Acidilobus sp.]|uniref:adenine deaminase C-terminal domain-containing protein n=1 Tax=Acidilobus sp. TaxID=1872109 RepID=UPI003D0229A4
MTLERPAGPSPQELVSASRAALGLEPLDLLIKDAEVVDVWGRRTGSWDVGVKGRVVACVGSCRSRARRVVNAKGAYLAPGFIDAHMHLESTFLSPSEFSKELVKHGTTAAFVDIHEVGNVLGIKGVYAVAEEFRHALLKVFLLAPPNVPPSRRVDDAGGASISYPEALEAARALSGLGEVMDLQSVVDGDEDLMNFVAEASVSETVVQGHMAGLSGPELDAYVSLGVRNDHEVTTREELMERLSRGVFPFVRFGSSWRDLDRLSDLVSRYSPLVPIVVDDIHALHLVREGHLDRAVRRAIELGVDPVDAVRAVTLAPALSYGLERWLGSVAPGRFADLVLLDSLDDRLRVIQTFINGSEAVCSPRKVSPQLDGNTVTVSFRPSFELRAPVARGQVQARVIELVNGSTITSESLEVLRVEDGRPIIKGDLSEVHVINRYGRELQGSGLLGLSVSGALASSVAHDTHNIIIVGSERDSMEAALEAIRTKGGGIAFAQGGSVKAFLPLPIAGLMSDLSSEEVASRLEDVTNGLSRACNCDGDLVLNQVQLLTLPVIPELRVTDKGLYSVSRRSYVPLFEVS